MQKRLDSLDVIRGVALAGIAFANVPTLWQLSYSYADLPINLLNLLVTQRIFPVFSLLFGIGFGMMWDRATQRSTRPRLVMLRRILGLGLFAAAHFYFHPGEALAPYAVAALVFLMPLTFVPDRRRSARCRGARPRRRAGAHPGVVTARFRPGAPQRPAASRRQPPPPRPCPAHPRPGVTGRRRVGLE